MVAFSKPVQDGNPPTKRKRTINPKLLDDDNMSSDAIKRRKLEAVKSAMGQASSGSSSQPSVAATTSSTNTMGDFSLTTPSVPPSTHQASVEIVDDEDQFHPNVGAPKNPDTILESVDDDDDDNMDFTPLVPRKDRAAKKKQTEIVEETTEKEASKKETDEEELGKLN